VVMTNYQGGKQCSPRNKAGFTFNTRVIPNVLSINKLNLALLGKHLLGKHF